MAVEPAENPYQYRPLRRLEYADGLLKFPMRILSLHPDHGGHLSGSLDQIIMEIDSETYEPQTKHQYEALSYCWSVGKEEGQPEFISIFDSEERRVFKFPIRANLACALRHLRSKTDHFRSLWIDAICIDQDNAAEKSEQVPLMGRIFHYAQTVVIWLRDDMGEEDRLAREHIDNIIRLEGFEKLIDIKYIRQWEALASLMRSDWFSRRWVVQEIAYAQSAMVYWGEQKVSWKDFADAVALFGSKAADIAELFRQDPNYYNRVDYLGDVEALSANRLVRTIGTIFRKSDNGRGIERLRTLEALVSNLWAFNTTRPHDIIYSMLTLAKDTYISASKPVKSGPDHGRRVSIVTRPHSRTGSELVDTAYRNLAAPFQDMGSRERKRSMDDTNVESLSPISVSRNAAIFDMATDSFEESKQKLQDMVGIELEGDEIARALERVKAHQAVAAEPFDYATMTQGMSDEIKISRLFWNWEAITWLSVGEKGTNALVLKLVLHERRQRRLISDVFSAFKRRVDKKRFHVSYEKKYFDVCKDFIDFTIRSSRSLDMLCRPWAPENSDLAKRYREPTELPSWICSLSKSPFEPRPDGNFGRLRGDLFVGLPETGTTVYKASKNTSLSEHEYFFGGPHGRNLFVEGLEVDTILVADIPALDGNIPYSWLELVGWEDVHNSDPPESFWRTIVADRDDKGQNPPSYYARACQYAFQQRTQRGTLNVSSLINNKISLVMTEYLKRLQAVVWSRKLVRTQCTADHPVSPQTTNSRGRGGHGDVHSARRSTLTPLVIVNGVHEAIINDHEESQPHGGRLGLVPHTARAGDKICILRGCSVPVVIRPLPSSYGATDNATFLNIAKLRPQRSGRKWKRLTCKLIGECYIHGLMDGEAFKIRDDNKLPDTIFEII